MGIAVIGNTSFKKKRVTSRRMEDSPKVQTDISHGEW